MYETLAILAAFVFLYSLVSGRLKHKPISGAIVYTVFGLCFGPLGLGLLNLDVGREGLGTLAEITLAIVLFTDAAGANLRVLKHSYRIPQRLLMIGLPLTIAAGYGVGAALFHGLTLLEVAILAVILTPTDAALGAAVVTDKSVPADIREGLNTESGLNDGICVPILLLFLALATGTGVEENSTILALKFAVQAIGVGAAVGVGLSLIGGRLFVACASRGWITETWRQLPAGALALICFAAAQQLGGSGFIASFVGGLLTGAIIKRHKHTLLLAAEGTGDVLALITWVVFGAAVVGQSLAHFRWEVILYAALSLTVVRMLPVFLSLAGMNLRADEKLFMGWFGPRGLASIVFAVIVLNQHLPGGGTIAITVVCTIMLSIAGHGISANPLIAALDARLKRSPDG